MFSGGVAIGRPVRGSTFPMNAGWLCGRFVTVAEDEGICLICVFLSWLYLNFSWWSFFNFDKRRAFFLWLKFEALILAARSSSNVF